MKNTVVKSHSRSTKGKKNTTVKRHARKTTSKKRIATDVLGKSLKGLNTEGKPRSGSDTKDHERWMKKYPKTGHRRGALVQAEDIDYDNKNPRKKYGLRGAKK